MISTERLIRIMVRKWQKVAGIRTKRISTSRTRSLSHEDCQAGITARSASNISSSTMLVAEKGNFVVYTTDDKRFELPIKYLNNFIMRELFRMSAEEFGLPSDGPITLPCDAVVMEYLLSFIRRRKSGKDMEKALVMSVATRCSQNYHGLNNQQLLVCS